MSINPNSTVVDTAEKLESLWTVDEVVAYLKVSRSLVYKKAESGELPSVRVFTRLRFDPAAIKAFALGTAATVTELSSRRK